MELGNLRLNLSALTPKNDEVKNEKVAETAKRKKKAKTAEPIEESWRRIFASKLSETDRQRLNEVKAAMEAGKLARNPSDCVNKAGNPKAFSKAEAMRLWKTLQEQRREETLRKMVENTPENYELITTEARFQSLIEALSNEKIIAVDTETTER
ncbi:hypothetical protein QKW52_15275 [Bacillus sonorensis]|nr:hypothetical protein [Bacillus sonorensis]